MEAERLTPPLNDGGIKKQSSLDGNVGAFLFIWKSNTGVNCKGGSCIFYPVVFTPKYRRQVIYGKSVQISERYFGNYADARE